MKQELKIIVAYLLLLLLLGAAASAFPHRELDWTGVVNVSLQLLLALLSLLIMKNTDDASQRMIFFFTSLYFGSGLLLLLSSFAGLSFLTNETYGPFFYHFFVNKVGLAMVSSLAVLGIAVDFIFRRLSAIHKSMLTLTMSGTLVGAFFFALISHPFGLHRERDYLLLQEIVAAESSVSSEPGAALSDADLAAAIHGEARKGSAFTAAETNRQELAVAVGRLRSYVTDEGLTIVFWRPLDLALTYLYSVLLAIIAVLLVFFYRSNKYHGAYIDKILILFFLFFAMEIMHISGFLVTPNAEEYRIIFKLGQYFTIFCLLLMVYTYDLKLRFVLSAAGKYYEFALSQHPETVTRWRDEVDRLILRAFLTRNRTLNKLGIFSHTHTKSD